MPEDKIVAGRSLTYKPRFNIPALTPNLEVHDCLMVDYRLKLTVGLLRNTSKGAIIRLTVSSSSRRDLWPSGVNP